jgi:hypothetical protein
VTSVVSRAGTVLFGDSVFGRMDPAIWFPGRDAHNGGLFGLRTDELLARVDRVIDGSEVCHGLAGNTEFPLECAPLPSPPARIVVFAGWNDLTQAKVDSTVLNLRKIVDKANAAGVAVTLCTVYPWDPEHPATWMTAPYTFYDPWRLPINRGIRATDNVSVVEFPMPPASYTIDGVHPDNVGYSVIAAALDGVVR